jgi:hypothetical protein
MHQNSLVLFLLTISYYGRSKNYIGQKRAGSLAAD